MSSQHIKFLVIGGGQQGQVVASQLAKIEGAKVTLADQRRDLKHPNPKVSIAYFDANDVTSGYRPILGSWFSSFNVVVSCLPSHFGGPCVALAAECGAKYVDLSFTTDNIFLLDPLAKHTGAVIIPDCGLAPGLPNFLSGRFMHLLAEGKGEKLPPLDIYVGGVSKDPKLPFGYVETWSLEDLYEEYIRPARYVENGKELRCSPLDPAFQKAVTINNTEFEAFTSDGLRTLLAFQGVIPNMREWTLRYPGHMKQVEEMIQRPFHEVNGLLPKKAWVKEFRSRIAPQVLTPKTPSSLLDVVHLAVNCAGQSYSLKVEGSPEITAMAKTTAYTCAVMAKFLYNGIFHDTLAPGVLSMESIGSQTESFSEVIALLRGVGLEIHLITDWSVGQNPEIKS